MLTHPLYAPKPGEPEPKKCHLGAISRPRFNGSRAGARSCDDWLRIIIDELLGGVPTR
jgi:hypothetical protein